MTADAVTGRRFADNVLLSEFAYHEHAGKVWEAAAPVTLTSGRVRVPSDDGGGD